MCACASHLNPSSRNDWVVREKKRDDWSIPCDHIIIIHYQALFFVHIIMISSESECKPCEATQFMWKMVIFSLIFKLTLLIDKIDWFQMWIKHCWMDWYVHVAIYNQCELIEQLKVAMPLIIFKRLKILISQVPPSQLNINCM